MPYALSALKADRECPFDLLSCISAVNWSTWRKETGLGEKPSRFSLYYNLYSISTGTRIFIEVYLAEGRSVPSAVSCYVSANWSEREIYDMMGTWVKDPPVAEVFRRRHILTDLQKHLQDARDVLRKLHGDPLAAYLSLQDCDIKLKAVKDAVKFALPHVVLPPGIKKSKNIKAGFLTAKMLARHEASKK